MADNAEPGITPVHVLNVPVTPPKRATLQQTKLEFAGSTPLKPGLSSIAYSGKTVQADIKPLIRTDAMGNIQDCVDVEKFVEAVWGFKAADLKLEEWAYLPSPKTLDALEKIFDEKRGEINMYGHVCDLFRDAYRQAKAHLKIEVKAAIEFLPMGSTQMRTAGQNFVQPDIMGVGTEAAARLQKSGETGPVTTLDIHLCFEAKRPAAAKSSAKCQMLRSKDNRVSARHNYPTPVYTPTSTDRNPPALDEHYHASTGSKRKAVSDTALPNKARKASESPLEPIPDVFSSGAAEEVRNAIDPNPGPELKQNELQLGSYALELLSQVGNRRYATAIYIRGRFISLWYFDRIGVLKTSEFNYTLKGIQPDPKKLLLVAVALSLCDRHHFGYEPLLRHPSPTPALATVEGADLVLPAGEVENRQGDKIPNAISLRVLEKALYVQCGIVGRGTVVLRVEPPEEEKAGLPSKFFTSKDLVAKLSWPVATRVAEDSLIRIIKSKIPRRWRRHLPDLQCSVTLDEDALSLPRSHLQKFAGTPEGRVLRILIFTRVLPLSELNSLDDFKKVFVDLIRCHRVVYQTAHVIHRDLSFNNVMFSLTSGQLPYGVLNDWDLGQNLERPRDTNKSDAQATARHRTGTAPFMALELLLDNPPRHLYRHDLESFVYILIWCAVHLDLDGHDDQVDPAVRQWSQGSWQQIYDHKRAFLVSPEHAMNTVYRAVKPAFKPLVKSWIIPLVGMLRDAYGELATQEHRGLIKEEEEVISNANQPDKPKKAYSFTPAADPEKDVEEEEEDEEEHIIDEDDEVSWDYETLGGRLTFENFMKIIGKSSVIPGL
ncbi:hypothetical protein EWM64_g6659 [Hericium alpestre]|uniref:Fungal-type protein kinase domain-containing protein n=1 Tax=Hericium alpestre TaxID=135208 RepID=A0A4Y9ZRZ2_9AGAM|nr:hypothetical protein EWM64_g6659 [Hericium alpestre]